MRRLPTLILSTAICLSTIWSTPSPPANARAFGKLDRACRLQLLDGHEGWSVKEVKLTISCAVHRWPVPGGLDKALDIAYRESRFHQFAESYTHCRGIYQWAPSTWTSVLHDFPPLYAVLGHNVYNARSNVLYAIKYAHNRSWAPWGG